MRPAELPAFRNPFHVRAIPSMGLTLGGIFFLEELTAPPLPVARGVGPRSTRTP